MAGTVTAALALVSGTSAPPAGAGALRTIVLEEDEVPPTVVAANRVTEETATGTTVRLAVLLTPPYAAVTVTGVEEETEPAAMLNLALVRPDGTVTLRGTVRAALELDSVTTAPAGGAGPFSVTLLVAEDFPEMIEAGESATDRTVRGMTVTFADFVTPPYVALKLTMVETAT